MKAYKARLVMMEFWDHCQTTGEQHRGPIKCKVIGMLYKQDKLAYYIATWVSEDDLDHNAEQFVILKKVVTKITTLHSKRKR